MSDIKRLSLRTYLGINLLLLSFTAVILLFMGRHSICTCGYIKLWVSSAWSSENSQQLFDYYTFSHIIHGFIFYFFLWRLKPNWSLKKRAIIALIIELLWEITENSPFIINRYRSTTASLDYYGDTIINSLFDSLSMVFGFWVAARIPVWVTVFLAIAMEIGTLIIIRDNLTLNVLMLIYPIEAVKQWQIIH